ncbi:hypothetical protein LTS14_007772 [Recurvomyces mirabilis]|uniref:uncharacterized protein n=1 Tax=Recurvomyces mirabilis TaxID=574656 RepID=UPI002DDF1B25|nr:hypothetical protein LTS14_007772 [Recurvomyces mirabilis]
MASLACHDHKANQDISDKTVEEHRDAEGAEQRSLRFANTTLDGCVEIRPAASPAHSRATSEDIPVSRRDVPVLGEIHSDAFPTSPSQRHIPGLLSSARARRHVRSRETSIPEDPVELQHFIQDRHVSRIPSHTFLVPDLPPPVPELVLPDGADESRSIINPFLDPGAPVFVPRTRFGTVTGSANESSFGVGLESRWSSLDSTHSSSNLRLRSSSEQNVDSAIRHRQQAHTQRGETIQPRNRRRSRVSDQNEPLPVLDRYPLLRPSTRSPIARRSSVAHRPARFLGRRPSRSSFVSSHALPTIHTSSSIIDHQATLDNEHDGRDFLQSSVEDVLPSGSRTLPRISTQPHITSRSSSLSWRDHITPSQRMPSITSAASGISRVLSSSDFSGHGINAADEFLLMRNSPLDELTERLSRLSGNRPRSVGRSWERTPSQRSRPSLLHGNPFRQDSPPAPPTGSSATFSSSPLDPDASLSQDDANVLHNAHILPIAPSNSATVGVASLAAAIAINQLPTEVATSSPRRPLADTSAGKGQDSPSKSGGVPLKPSSPTMATPRVKIYDDARPGTDQPQTPADVIRPSHRFRGRSDVVTQASMAALVQAAPPPPPVQRQQNRHTYPSAATPAAHASPPAQALHALRNAASTAAHQILQHARIHRHRPSSDENGDRDLHAFEEERRVWVERQDAVKRLA